MRSVWVGKVKGPRAIWGTSGPTGASWEPRRRRPAGQLPHHIAIDGIAHRSDELLSPEQHGQRAAGVLGVLAVAAFGGFALDAVDRFHHYGGILEESMATLNVKNFPDRLYRKLQARAKRQHRSVAQEVTHILSEALEEPEALSILDLQGLGKHVWSGIDAPDHVAGERRSWD